MTRLIALLLFASAILPGQAPPTQSQVSLSVVTSRGEQPFDTFLDLGASPLGDPLDTRIRLRNTGTADLRLDRLIVNGTGYTINNTPALPYPVSRNTYIDFTIRFTATTVGAQTGALVINQSTVVLKATGSSAVLLYQEQDGRRTLLPTGTTIAFGNVERGTSLTKKLVIVNTTPAPITVSNITAGGASFQLGAANLAPVTLAPQQERVVPIVFSPQTLQSTGQLQIDARAWPLSGTLVEPAFPAMTLTVNPTTLTSAQQGRLIVKLAGPAPTNASGRVKLEFQGASSEVKDDAIQFVANSSRSLEFIISQGETQAKFGSLTEAIFQTGTSAGTFAFTAELGPAKQTLSISVAAGPMVISQPVAVRSADSIQLTISGYDPTRSVSLMTFMFYDKSGVSLTPGGILYDAASDFRRYFGTSTQGGSFKLRATFPVNGDISGIGSMDIDMTNTNGHLRTDKITIN